MTVLERLLRHDACTTRSLLILASDLPDSALDREFDIGHRSLRITLLHIIRNMECWYDLMAANAQRLSEVSSRPVALSSLTGRLDIVSEQLLTLGNSVIDQHREEELFLDNLDDPPGWKPIGAGLLHIATHGMHHRAQCLYMLKGLGVKHLPEADALSWELGYRGWKVWPAVSSADAGSPAKPASRGGASAPIGANDSK
jgi:uncharacterized damage-inducible protein DinB